MAESRRDSMSTVHRVHLAYIHCLQLVATRARSLRQFGKSLFGLTVAVPASFL
jgi:hypothetical protein